VLIESLILGKDWCFVEEEISLRELIEVLLKWKWLIVAVTVAAVAAAGFVSFFVLPEKYEAVATLLVNEPWVIQSITSEEEMPQPQPIPLETYVHQIKSSAMLSRVRERLGLDPKEYTIRGLRNSITVENPKNTQLLNIKVVSKDPKMAQKIANTLAKEFVNFINIENKEQLNKSSVMLAEQLKSGEEKLGEVLEEQKQFLSQPQSVAELQQEVDSKIEQLTEYKAKLMDNRVLLDKKRRGLEVARKQLKETPEVLVTDKRLVNDTLLASMVRNVTGREAESLSGLTLKYEEINPLYIELQRKILDYESSINELETENRSLERAIAETRAVLEDLQVELAEKQAEYEKLQTRIDTLKSNYSTLSRRYEEAQIASSLDKGDTSIILTAPAVEPVFPVGPRKMLNIAIAAVLGLMVSVFAAFFWEYWTSTSQQGGKESAISGSR